MNLYVTNYQKAFLYLDLDGQTYNVGATLDENMAREMSVIMRTVQWNKLDGEPEGVPVGRFIFRDTYDPYKSATLYSGMRLVSDGKVAQLTSGQWDTVCQLMINSRAMNDRMKVELQGKTYRLNFSGDPHFFTLSGPGREGENAPVGGYYTVFGADICVCYGWDGEVFILRMEDGGLRLLPGYNGLDAFDIPDDTVFTP